MVARVVVPARDPGFRSGCLAKFLERRERKGDQGSSLWCFRAPRPFLHTVGCFYYQSSSIYMTFSLSLIVLFVASITGSSRCCLCLIDDAAKRPVCNARPHITAYKVPTEYYAFLHPSTAQPTTAALLSEQGQRLGLISKDSSIQPNPAFEFLTTCFITSTLPLLPTFPIPIPELQPIRSSIALPLFSLPNSGAEAPTTSPSM
jgi:hypothetical protein